MKLLATNIGRLRIIGFGEAISWLLLLGFAMPMKYIWHNPLPVKYVGWIHGLLFISYIAMAYIVKEENKVKESITEENVKLLPSVKEIWLMGSTFGLICITWVFFRAKTITDAVLYLKRICSETVSLCNTVCPVAS